MRFCPLCSGSSGNSTYIEAGNIRILIDAGLSCKRITALMNEIGADPAQLTAILVTHEHSDHIKGIEILSSKYSVPVYANRECWSAMRNQMARVKPSEICVFESDKTFYIGGVEVFPFTTYHDSVHSVGFVIRYKEHKVAVCTDIGHIDKRILEILSGCELVLLEANHDVDMLMAGSYPYLLKKRILSGTGHLCNEDCANTLVELYHRGVRNAILGHLSKENNYPELALITVHSALKAAGIDDKMQIALALRDRPTGIFEL